MAPIPPASTATVEDVLTTQEKLLLSQAVYKLGAADWPGVSRLLVQHPCCKHRPDTMFSPQECETTYIRLMGEAGMNVPAPDGIKPAAKTHLRLAQTFYLSRLAELKAQIASYEKQFTSLVDEIARLKRGELDGEVRAELRAVLARKYGKRLLDAWVPEEDDLNEGIEKGKPSEEEETAELERVDAEAKGTERVVDEGMTEDVEMSVGSPKEEEEEEGEGEEAEEEAVPKDEIADEDEEEADEEEEEKPKPSTSARGRKRATTPPSVVRTPSPAGSDLSPPPSVPPTKASAEDASGPTRSSKRKASAQPRGAPPSKRGGRRAAAAAASPATTVPESEALSDAADEEEQEEEELLPRRAGGGRASKRRLKSPAAASSKTKDSSPAVSRRAPSVSSTTSAQTPGGGGEEGEKRGGRAGRGGASGSAAGRKGARGMRDDVVSRHVREMSGVESVKEEAAEEDEAEDEEEAGGRGRRGRGARKDKEKEKEKEKEVETTAKRTKRGSTIRTPGPLDGDSEKGGGGRAGHRGGRVSLGKDEKASQKMLYSLLEAISSHRNGNVFQAPVKKSDAPDYYDIIKKPMDLKTIRQKIRDGQLSSIDEFERDVLLIFANAMMYNDEDSQVYEMAEEMLKDTENHIARFRSMAHDFGR